MNNLASFNRLLRMIQQRHIDTCSAKPPNAASLDTRSGVKRAYDNPPNPGGDNRVSAGRRVNKHTAWLKRYIQISFFCACSCLEKSLHFSMWPIGRCGSPSSGDLSVAHDNGTDGRTWAGAAFDTARTNKCLLHSFSIIHEWLLREK
ncbi:MAG: hypothetical protein NVS3B14_06390 [Ktedonobacteraceae bacterium]